MDKIERLTEHLISLVKECDLNEDGGIKNVADSDIDYEKLRVNFELFMGKYIEDNFFSDTFKDFSQ